MSKQVSIITTHSSQNTPITCISKPYELSRLAVPCMLTTCLLAFVLQPSRDLKVENVLKTRDGRWVLAGESGIAFLNKFRCRDGPLSLCFTGVQYRVAAVPQAAEQQPACGICVPASRCKRHGAVDDTCCPSQARIYQCIFFPTKSLKPTYLGIRSVRCLQKSQAAQIWGRKQFMHVENGTKWPKTVIFAFSAQHFQKQTAKSVKNPKVKWLTAKNNALVYMQGFFTLVSCSVRWSDLIIPSSRLLLPLLHILCMRLKLGSGNTVWCELLGDIIYPGVPKNLSGVSHGNMCNRLGTAQLSLSVCFQYAFLCPSALRSRRFW